MAPPPLSAQEDTNRRMLRARDEMDRRYADPLDVPTLAAGVHVTQEPAPREAYLEGLAAGMGHLDGDAYDRFMRAHDNPWL